MHVNKDSIINMVLATILVIPTILVADAIGYWIGIGHHGGIVIVAYIFVMFIELVTMVHIDAWEEPFWRRR